MTRKRYIKLEMADGLSRNEANQNAREIVAEGLSYEKEYYNDPTVIKLTQEQIQALAELNLSAEQILEAWENIKGPLVEIIDRFKRALSAAAVAFIEAMNQEETP